MAETSRVTYRDNVRMGSNYCHTSMQCYKPFLRMLRGKVTQFAYHKCEQEALRADKYEHEMLHVLCCIYMFILMILIKNSNYLQVCCFTASSHTSY
jgi:hypothetical protein